MYAMAPTLPHHLFQVGALLRQEDIDEALYGGFEDHFQALLSSVVMSDETFTVFAADGEPIGIWGYVEDSFGDASVWAVGTDRFVESPKDMLRTGQVMRDVLLERHGTIYNKVFVGNTKHIDWLKRLGAEFIGSDENFVHFEIRKWTQ